MIKIKVNEYMGRLRMSQKELSELTNINPMTISKYYKDSIVRIDREHLNQFCKVFNCSISDLIEYTPD
ncbi:MAG: helix-turn-helix transcriptional regulator [Patescibacteria group bacterium]